VSNIVLELPDSLRSELKAPLGPVYTDSEALLRDASEPIVAVGDVVTYHLIEADYTPAVALVDERTERESVRDVIADTIAEYEGFEKTERVSNPPATLTEQLLSTLSTALADAPATSTLIEVDGEEDLAALPAVMMASRGTSIVYGQPGEGMVLGTVDETLQANVRDILSRMDGDSERFWVFIN
jgi:uncharacterized protein (UPF0218 family)